MKLNTTQAASFPLRPIYFYSSAWFGIKSISLKIYLPELKIYWILMLIAETIYIATVASMLHMLSVSGWVLFWRNMLTMTCSRFKHAPFVHTLTLLAVCVTAFIVQVRTISILALPSFSSPILL
jgi:hypothetical protein